MYNIQLTLIFKHSYVTVAAYKRRQMKYLKYVSEIFAKTPKKYLKTITNIWNV
jgi:hypothetical protein